MQQVNIYEPIEAHTAGPPPLVIRAVINRQGAMVVGGTPTQNRKMEPYVLLSALPDELRQRVELAIQMLITAG